MPKANKGAAPAADWREKARETAKKKAAGGRFKLKEGDNHLRVLPALTAGDPPFAEFRVHANVGPKKGFVNCGKNVEGKGKCWLCDVQIPKLQRGNSAQQKLAESIAPKDQMFLNVASVDDNGKFHGPHQWTISAGGAKSLAVQVLNMLGSRRRQYDHPAKGYNFVITRTGTGLDTRYTAPEPDEEPSEVPADIIKACKPLVTKAASEAEQKATFFGKDVSAYTTEADDEDNETEAPDEEEDEESSLAEGDDDEDDDDEEEAPPVKSKKAAKEEKSAKGKKKPAPVVEEEDDEDDDDEEEDDEDEEPAPAPKKGKKPAPPADDDDDEEEDEDDEDDEESDDDDDDSDDEEDEDEDEDDEPPPPPKKVKKPSPAPAKKGKKK